MLEVTELLGRAKNGATEPFICRCSDGSIYYIKGVNANRVSQANEWIAGRLAAQFGLPVPPFEMVMVDPKLASVVPGLGSGLAFGSKKVEALNPLNITTRKKVPAELRRDVFAFDWWVKNSDRTLTEFGGNPNLFWNEESAELVVLDHNLAFESADSFSKKDFVETHAFSGEYNGVFEDLVSRCYYFAKMEKAAECLSDALNEIPESWHFVDEDCTVKSKVDLDKISAIVSRYKDADFWERP